MATKRAKASKTAEGALTLPRATSTSMVGAMQSKPSRTGGMRFNMREWVGTVKGAGIHTLKVSPTSFNGSWTRTMCWAFERYKFHSINFSFVPCVGTDVSGLVSAGFDNDPLDAFKDTMSGIIVGTNTHSGPAWSPFTLRVPPSDWKYVSTKYENEYARDALHGTLAWQLSDSAYNLSVMHVFVSYDIELIEPTFSIHQMAIVLSKQMNGDRITNINTTGKWFSKSSIGNLLVENSAYGDLVFRVPGEYQVDYRFSGTNATNAMESPIEVDEARTSNTLKYSVSGKVFKDSTGGPGELAFRVLVKVAAEGMKLALKRSLGSAWESSWASVSNLPWHS